MGYQSASLPFPESLNVNTPNYTAALMGRSSIWKLVDHRPAAVVVAAAPLEEMSCGVIASAIDDPVHSCPLSRLTR
jgi:hypothetical protein